MDLFDYDFSNNETNDSSKVIFFDTETTGAKEDDEIIQIGAIIEDLEGNYELFDELCGTSDTKLIDVGAMVVHGIRNENIKNKAPFIKSTFYSRLNELNSNQNYLVAHNLPFDLGRLEYHGFRAKLKLIDTLQCAKHLFELDEKLGSYEYTLPNYKLQTFRYILFSQSQEEEVAAKYGINIRAHNAISDVVILKIFFDALLERLRKECSSCSYLELLDKLVELSSKPIMVKKFNFGKYRGRLLKDILVEDRGYLEWLYRDSTKRKESGESVDENLYNTLKELLEQV